MNYDQTTKTVTLTQSDVDFLNMWREQYGRYNGFDIPGENNPSFFVDALRFAGDFTDDDEQKQKFEKAFDALNEAEIMDIDESVRELPDYMFDWGLDDQGKFPAHLFIGKGVRRIGKGAFNGCHIESLEFSDSLAFIDDDAFRGTHIVSLELPDGVWVGKSAFADSSYLKTVIIGIIRGEYTEMTDSGYVTDIVEDDGVLSDGIFSHDSQMTNLYASEQIWNIGDNAFCGCENLENLDIKGLKLLGDWSLAGCEHLNIAGLDMSEVEYIGESALSWTKCSPEILKVSEALAEGINLSPEHQSDFCRHVGLAKKIEFVSSDKCNQAVRQQTYPDLPNSAFVFTEEENGIEI